jgi:heat shock protein HslJ/uncharacterized lipoprotein NlpE involved in copper resistance
MFASKTPIRAALSFLLVLFGSAAYAEEKPAAKSAEARFVGGEPRTYAGDFPCADCEGIRMTLDLFPVGAFVLRQEYLGKNRASVDLGRWIVSEEGRVTLTGGSDEPRLYRAAAEGVLRKLDARGNEIESTLNYDLKREASFRLIEDPVEVSGLFVYMADAGRIALCPTEQDLPVAQAGDNAALEKAYGEKRTGPGEPLLVTVTGHLADRPKMEGSGTELSFVVEKFEKASPGEPCPVRLPAGIAPVKTPAGRTWTLVSLRGQSVSGGSGRKAFELRLDTGGHDVHGFTGCNKLRGRYVIEGSSLTLSELGTTRMTCPDTADKERAYLQVLGDVRGWKLSGNRLLLYGRRDVIAEFVEKEEY